MGLENESNKPIEQNTPVKTDKQIHQSHFTVQETPYKDSDRNDENNNYEWVKSGLGRLKRVLKNIKTTVIRKM